MPKILSNTHTKENKPKNKQKNDTDRQTAKKGI